MAYSGLKALIIGPAWVGDMVMSHTLVQLLAARFTEIHVAAPLSTVPVAERMAEVTSVTPLDINHGQLALGARFRAGRALAELAADTAFVLPNSWKSALIPFFAQIKQRVGWLGEARYGLLNERHSQVDQYPLMIERFMALSGTEPQRPYPTPVLQVDTVNRDRLISEHGLEPGSVIGLAPGAEFGPAKKWPVQHYAEVARTMVARGHQVWLFGSPGDVKDCEVIAAEVPAVVNLAGKTKLADAIDLLSAVQQVVCNDSGLMHVASALGVPTVGIFGSTSTAFTPPLGENAEVAQLEMSCRPCFSRVCPLGHTRCLHDLQPAVVLDRMAASASRSPHPEESQS